MPNVADELADLRKRSLAKNQASKLKDANGFSTPEHEASTLKDSKDKTRTGTYSKDAVENIKAGTKAVDQDLDFKIQQKTKKKEDMKKQKEAAKDLQSFNEAKLASSGGKGKAATEAKPAASTPIIEEVPEIDDIPQLETVEPESSGGTPEAVPVFDPIVQAPRVQNRAEKKARKVMERLGMKPVAGISRVTLKMQGSQGFFTVYQPDVYEKNGSYIVFGEARQGGAMPRTQEQQTQAAHQLGTPVVKESAAKVTEEPEETVDETGVETKDIELVTSQAGCSRSRAVAALKDNNGDLVNAIMSLTS